MYGKPKRPVSPGSDRRARLHLEPLETRRLLTVLTPAQVRHAYGFDNLADSGAGQTIAVIVAGDNPTARQDLQTFDRQFGLPDPSFLKATPQGQPGYDPGWALESALDVEWAHAIAPGANILLVEARTSSLSDLLGAVDYARHYPGVSVVSMSWGGNEFPGENYFDGVFTTPRGHNGVTFVAASGDTGGQQSYPATSPNVVAVGGTVLNVAGGAYAGETTWAGSGGGASAFEGVPDYQAGWTISGRRLTPDVAYGASPAGAFYVRRGNAWYAVGGTSAGAPQWAGLFALADQGLNARGVGTLDGRTQTLPALYSLAAANYRGDFHDIVAGQAGGLAAGPGYDLATGIGSPVADHLVPALVSLFAGTRTPAVTPAPVATATRQPVRFTPVSRHDVQTDGADPTLATAANARSVTVATLAGQTFALRPTLPASTQTEATADFRSRPLPPSAPRLAHSDPDRDEDAPGVRDGDGNGTPVNETPDPSSDDTAPTSPEAVSAPHARDSYFAALGSPRSADPDGFVIELINMHPDILGGTAGLALLVAGSWNRPAADQAPGRKHQPWTSGLV